MKNSNLVFKIHLEDFKNNEDFMDALPMLLKQL